MVGTTPASVAEIRRPKSSLFYVCTRSACKDAKNEANPLYTQPHIDAIVKEDAKKLFDSFVETNNTNLASLKADLAKAQTANIELSAQLTAKTNSAEVKVLQEEVDQLRGQLRQAREEALEAISMRRTSLPGTPAETEKIRQMTDEIKTLKNKIQEISNLKAKERDVNALKSKNETLAQAKLNLQSIINGLREELAEAKKRYDAVVAGGSQAPGLALDALNGEIQSLKQQNAQLSLELLANQKTIDKLRLASQTDQDPPLELFTQVSTAMTPIIAEIKEMMREQMAMVNDRLDDFKVSLESETPRSAAVPKVVSYASALTSGNADTIRTIRIPEENRGEILAELRGDPDLGRRGVKSVRQKAPGLLTVRCDTAFNASGMETLLKTKYKEKVEVRQPKNLTPQIKIVHIPTLSDQELIDKLREQNDWLEDSTLEVNQQYGMAGPRKNYKVAILDCDIQTQLQFIERGTCMLGFSEKRCFEHVELMGCGKCMDFSHVSANCKNKLSCRHCSEEHHVSGCPNKERPPVCSNCKRHKYPHNHSLRDHRCKSRIERIEGLKAAASSSKN